jgi:hypothetical protein
LKELPDNRPEDALPLKIRQWSPFAHYADYIVWQNDTVLVWVWDAHLQQQTMAQASLKNAYTLPESVLRPALPTDGERLLVCLEGIEGQIWRNGILIASRWWSISPDLRDWNQFLRAHSLATVAYVPTPEQTDLALTPWGKARRRFAGLRGHKERDWIFLGTLLFVVITTWKVVEIVKIHAAVQSLQARLEGLNDQATPVLKARNLAINNKQEVERLLSMNAQLTQLELMTMVQDKLPPQAGVKVVDWAYQSGELKVTIEAPYIDPRQYVENFQSQPLFLDVKSETGRNANQIIVSMRISTSK